MPPLMALVDHESATVVASELPSGSAPPVTSLASSAKVASGEPHLLAGRYELLALVGAGGMGTVYRARDRELDEVVALKVMRPELVATPGILERFRREAKLARRVTHTNVARVFDIGEHEGEKFLTMELVDGESLSAAIAREGSFSFARALEIGAAIADGLSSAHAAGVVHRDLKPDNVLLGRDGRVVVTDFGIARAVAAALDGGASSTMGALVGTPAYMAPEQVEARGEIDARADVYAFGALLYELFTGQRAWPGESLIGVAAARLLGPGPDPRAIRPDLPAECAELVMRCMARSPDDRPASMAEVGRMLGRIALPIAPPSGPIAPPPPTLLAGTPAPAAPKHPTPPHIAHAIHDGAASCPKPRADMARATPAHATPPHADADKTVAVLPFRNAGPPEDAYLAEELTDDLLDALSMTRGLKVRPRGAVLRYRGVELDPREIGRELGVQVVVEGSVRRARGSVRCSVRLVSVADGFQIWAKRFDRPEQDVLSINDDAAHAIAQALTVAARPEGREAPSDPVAIDLYIRGRHEYRQFWPDHVRRATELFEQALALAPDDPLVLSALALAHARMCFFVGEPEFARARRVAEHAVAAGPQLGEAHLALGSVLFQIGETAGAVRSLRAAVARNPGLADAHGALGRLLIEVGVVDDGIHRLEAALALDPEAPLVQPDLVRVYALLDQWDKAEVVLERLGRKEIPLTYWTMRVRMALWQRQGAVALEIAEHFPSDDSALRIPRAFVEVVRTGAVPRGAFEVEAGIGNGRRAAFLLQIRAEVLGYLRLDAQVIEALEGSVDAGLIDFFWLERCPLLEGARRLPRFAAIHQTVKRRADAVVEAYRAA